MSRSEVEGAGTQERADINDPERVDREDRDVPAPGAGRLPTGDPAVDEVLDQLDGATHGSLDTQIEVSEQVHRVLQGRLADLGKE